MKSNLKLGASIAAIATLAAPAIGTALAADSWYSKARIVDNPATLAFDRSDVVAEAQGDIGTTVFDIVISVYDEPSGDGDPDVDSGTEEQTDYEDVIEYFADSVCEQSNAQLKLGKVRFFPNGVQGSLADVVWNENEWPRANVSGFGRTGRSIIFGDVFPDGCGSGCDIDFFSSTSRKKDAGYTLGHEFGHYVVGVYDEYVGNDASETRINFPQTGDTPVSPSIMNSQWNATTSGADDYQWLNHSTSDNYEANTAQGRVFGASAWEVMIQPVGDDPKDGDRADLAQRVRYTALDGAEPDAGDGWIIENLDEAGAQAACRSELEIIWMQDDVEMQIVVDRSGSMDGDPLANAQTAAQTLVTEAEDGATAIGVVSFSDDAVQDQAITPIPNPPGTTKDDINAVIAGLTSGGDTSMFDAAKLALDNIVSYASTNATNAAQLVFLLTDGIDNDSTETQNTVTTDYQDAEIPLITFAYGEFAPDGVLRQMAEATGGFFRASPTSLAEIQSSFLAAKAAFTSSAGVLQENRSIASGATENFSFDVDGTLKEVSLFAVYEGAPGDVSFAVNSPTGPSGISFVCKAVSTETACSTAIPSASLMTGTWSVSATNTNGGTIPLSFDVLATPKPERTFDLVVAPVGGEENVYPAPLFVTAVVSKELPITDVAIAARITDPDGAVAPFAMNDSGVDGDGVAGDGIYTALLTPTKNGLHLIRVDADNDAMMAKFTDGSFQPSHGFSAGEGGVLPSSPVLPPINDGFTRTASTLVNVSGVVFDDHPNSPPGTPIVPDNSDNDGRMEYVGDVDVLSAPTAGFDSMTFRVTGLAQGMDPRLRVLDEGGAEIISATIDDLIGDPAYLALSVPVGASATLHAEVSHADLGLGIYQVSAGSRIVSDPVLFELDILPDTEENPVQVGSPLRIPVLVKGNALYDPSLIDPDSLAFGPDGAPARHPKGGVIGDYDGDGYVDYLNFFVVRDSGLTLDDTEACLRGTVDGVPFEACDMIRVVPK